MDSPLREHASTIIPADETLLRGYVHWSGVPTGDPLTFDCALPAVRDHVARVCAAGARCNACMGGATAHQCGFCAGTGWTLRPTPIEHLLDRPGSRLSGAQSAVLCAWSYRSWRRGGPVIQAVGNAADIDCTNSRAVLVTFCGLRTWLCATEDDRDFFIAPDGRKGCGWQFGDMSGPEVGGEARACILAAALAHNFAYLDNGAIVVPPENA